MTAQQRESIAGAELLALCQSVAADGRLADDELANLRTWLEAHPDDEFPAIAHIRWVIEQVLADGVVTPDENKLLRQTIEKILPPDVRSVVALRHREAEREDAQVMKAAKTAAAAAARADVERNRPLLRLDFMLAGTRYAGRGRIIADEVDEGTPVVLMRDLENRHSRHAVQVCLADGRQIGFVPEDLAVECAPLLDEGAQSIVNVKRVIDRANPPIPIIAGALYRVDATLPPPEQPRAVIAPLTTAEYEPRGPADAQTAQTCPRVAAPTSPSGTTVPAIIAIILGVLGLVAVLLLLRVLA